MENPDSMERRLRRHCAKRGLILMKCRERLPSARGHGRYVIADQDGKVVAGRGYTLTPKQVEQWLDRGDPGTPVEALVITGHALDRLRTMKARSFDACVTSPPYWFLRDNRHKRQIGMERTPDLYVKHLVEVFEEVRRVLRPSGTLWLNIGDSIANRRMVKESGKLTRPTEMRWREATERGLTLNSSQFAPFGFKVRDALLLPWEVAAALRRSGWYLHPTITWVKSSAAPDLATDRPRRVSEPVFLLTKRASGYHYTLRPGCETDVWTLPPARGDLRHSSTMPEELARRCIEIGSPPGGRIVDPFGGLSTTGVAAGACGREAVCIEINPVYARHARDRLQAAARGK